MREGVTVVPHTITISIDSLGGVFREHIGIITDAVFIGISGFRRIIRESIFTIDYAIFVAVRIKGRSILLVDQAVAINIRIAAVRRTVLVNITFHFRRLHHCGGVLCRGGIRVHTGIFGLIGNHRCNLRDGCSGTRNGQRGRILGDFGSHIGDVGEGRDGFTTTLSIYLAVVEILRQGRKHGVCGFGAVGIRSLGGFCHICHQCRHRFHRSP